MSKLLSTKMLPHKVARWYRFLRTKNPNLGIFRKALERRFYIGVFTHIVYILQSFGRFLRFGMLYHDKSGSPGRTLRRAMRVAGIAIFSIFGEKNM
jgi:hypothetical protein